MASFSILSSTTTLKQSPSPLIKGPPIPLQALHMKFSSSSLSYPTSKDSSRSSSRSCLTSIDQYLTRQAEPTSVSQKVRALDSEFRSLSEPIDRVKRLLHYATLLPRFDDESFRTPENRVSGCAAQVWLEVRMDRDGAMRFRVDSDSEITKGFCSRLIWLFDGAEADEVLSVRCDDLVEMNVGFPMKGSSRVNAWNSVLDVMQRKTKALVEQRRRRRRDLPV